MTMGCGSRIETSSRRTLPVVAEKWVKGSFEFLKANARKRVKAIKKNPRHFAAAVAVTAFLFVVHEATAGSVGVAWVVAVVEGFNEVEGG